MTRVVWSGFATVGTPLSPFIVNQPQRFGVPAPPGLPSPTASLSSILRV
jgi:hypothetical protein